MGRAGFVFIMVVVAAAPACALAAVPGPLLPALNAPLPEHGPGRAIDLSVAGAIREMASSHMAEDRALPESPQNPWSRRLGIPGVSFGSMSSGGSGINGVRGRRSHYATFVLDGTTVLGGSIGASLDGRSANVVLSWPTGD